MRKLASFLTSALALLVLACLTCGCGGQVEPQWAHPDVLVKAGLKYYWMLDLPLRHKEQIEQVWLMDENLYCLSNQNYLWAVDAARGQTKWYVRISSPAQTVFKPAHANDLKLAPETPGIAGVLEPGANDVEPFDAVIVNTLSEVLVLDRKDGRLVRRIDLRFAANTGGASDGRNFYVGSTDGKCQAIALREEVPIWQVATSSLLTAPIIYADGLVFMAGHDGTVTVAQAGPKSNIVWRRRVGGPVSTEIAGDARGCFVGAEDNKIYAFAAQTGANLWKPFICEGQIRTPVQTSAVSVFAYAQGDRFYTLNLVNGRQRWSLPEGRMVLAVMDGQAYVLGPGQELYVVDEMLGAVSYRLSLLGMEMLAANTTAPAIYGVNADGQVRCIRAIEARYVTEELLRQHQP